MSDILASMERRCATFGPNGVSFLVVAVVKIAAGSALMNRHAARSAIAAAPPASAESPLMSEHVAGMLAASQDRRFGDDPL